MRWDDIKNQIHSLFDIIDEETKKITNKSIKDGKLANQAILDHKQEVETEYEKRLAALKQSHIEEAAEHSFLLEKAYREQLTDLQISAEDLASGKLTSKLESKIKDLQKKIKETNDKDEADKLKKDLAAAKKLQESEKKHNKEQHEEKVKRAKELTDKISKELGLNKNSEQVINAVSEQLIKEYGESTDADEIAQAVEDSRKAIRKVGPASLSALGKDVAKFLESLKSSITTIANAKTSIDTRLQGLNAPTYLGSYWERMSKDIKYNIGISPFVQQEKVVENIKSMVSQGIAFNVEERAVLATIKDQIATTFDATNDALLRLVRIQQQDTTAARLGMESALTSFLNNMYETSEYMQSIAQSIKGTIEEASALMTAENAVAFEYQVQKWLGSLYSVGFSQSGITNIANALGQAASGNISGITSETGRLLVMAANQANIPLSDILADGLDDSETNRLLQAAVDYLGDIYNETSGNNLLAQQFAGVFGLTASDLKAAANLSNSLNDIYDNTLNYNGMLSQLQTMASTSWQRVGTPQMLQNIMANFKYTTAETIANNPMAYLIMELATAAKDIGGGGNIPFISAAGFGVDLNTNIADLMLMGTLGFGMLGSIGSLIGGLRGGLGLDGILKNFGIGATAITSRGTGSGLLTTGYQQISESGYVGNASGSDVQQKTLDDAYSDANNQLVEATESQDETKLSTVDEHIVNIYNLLSDVVNGSSYLHVINDSYAFPNGASGGGL